MQAAPLDLDPASTPDLGPLAWVLDELRKSLESASSALRRFVRDAAAARGQDMASVDAGQLRIARQHMHQAVGALEMVGLPAPAHILRSMEAAVQKFVERPELCTEPAAAKVERAGFALAEYLEALLLGRQVSPLSLFPQYRDVQELWGAERVHPADLWMRDWRWLEPEGAAAGQALAYHPAVRARMDQAVLQIVKSADATAARELAALSLRLAAGQGARQPRVFWKIAAGYFEALGAGLLPSDVYVKRAASRVLLQYASLAKGDPAVSERLAQDLVFFCAQARPARPGDVPALAAVRAAHGLDGQPPVDYTASPFGRFDPAVLAQARKRIAAARETWSALAGGDTHKLKAIVEQVAAVSEALLKLYPASEPLTRALGAAADAVLRSGRAPATGIAMEVATAILYLEAALQDLDPDLVQAGDRAARLAQRLDRVLQGAEPEPLEPWMEELYRRVSDRQTLGSVVGELRATLGELEKVLDQFFRQPGETAVLRQVPAYLAQMRGVLSVLGLDQAGLALQRMRETVEQMLAGGTEAARAGGAFERMGHSLGALGFLIDMLSYQPVLAKKLFVYDEQLGELRPLMGRAPAAVGAPQGDVPTGADASAPAVAQPPDAEAPPAVAEPEVLGELLVAEPVEVESAVVVAAVPPPAADAEEDTDDELLTIFLDEARDVTAGGLAAVQVLQVEPDNLQELTTLRRAFHTLKGSSRMVGLHEFGDAGWALEQLLNTWLADRQPAGEDLRAVTRQALEAFEQWAEDIAAGTDGAWSAAPFRASADALRLEGQRLPLALPGADTADASQVSEAPEADFQPTAGLELPRDFEPTAGFAAEDDFEATAFVPPQEPAAIEGLEVVEDFQPTGGLELPAAAPEAPGWTTAFPPLPDLEPPAEPSLPTLDAAAAEPVPEPSSAEAPPLVFDFDLELPGAAPLAPAPELPTGLAVPASATFDAPDASFEAEEPTFEAPEPSFDLPASAFDSAVAEPDGTPPPLALDFDLDFGDALFGPDGPTPTESVAAQELRREPEAPPAAAAATGEPLAGFADLGASLAADRAPVAPDREIELPEAGAYAAPAVPSPLAPPPAGRVLEPPVEASFDAFGMAAPAEPAWDEPGAAAGVAARGDDSVKVIGDLRIGIPLYNVYLNEADEWSRRLATEISEWTLGISEPVPEASVGWAHALAGASATVGFHALSDICRTLESALQRVRDTGWGTPQHAAAFTLAAEEIRWLLHQFAAGFLKQPDPGILAALEALKDIDMAAQPAPSAPAPVAASAEPRVSQAAAASAEDDGAEFDVADAVDPDLLPIFAEEAAELMPQIGGQLRLWHAHPHEREPREGVLRALHTLKGSARLAGALRLGELAHRLESEVEDLRGDAIAPADVDTLLHRFDQMQARFETLRATGLQGGFEPPALEGAPQLPVDAEAGEAGAEAPARVPVAGPVVTALAATRQAARQSVRVRAQLLDRLMDQAGEVMITRSRLEAELKQLRGCLADLTGNLDRLRAQLRDIELQAETQMHSRLAVGRDAAANFDPLEFDRYTRVQELTRMMAESVNDVATVQRNIQRAVEATEDDLVAQARQTRALQRDLLRTRMVEFESIADRLYRVVRLAAKETGKQVTLDIEGGTIEMDRGVLDRMTPAFEHLLRNCVAHGIEAPDARAAAGKPAAGRITVHVRQEGNDVAVAFGDDGAGIDLPALRAKAAQQGLVAPGAVLDDAAAADLVFLPGLSTAAEVSELAGRGIGMDVVRSEVNALGGRIETQTAAGRGTSFRLVLPLTTAVTQVVVVRCGRLVVGVPANLVEIVRRANVEQVHQAYAAGSFEEGGEALPFFWAGALLQNSARGADPQGRTAPVVIFRSAAQRVAVHVDEVLGNQEVVVKNLGPQLARLPGLAGMTVLASGAVVLIYNPVALAQVYGETARAWALAALHAPAGDGAVAAPGTAAPDLPPLVLVVDDSITVRRVTQRLLQREGWRVALASDGLQALERLAEERPAVVLSDIEMPRMDGFDLVRNIRADDRLAGLPIVMITSRIAQKHREHARELGVDHYLGKPYSEEELLALVRKLAGHDAVVA